jgi:NAD(P)-dependent dehydrogenase (short-subunit alcohol dehydrogenase family)
VVVADWRAQAADETVRQIVDEGHRAIASKTDVSNSEDIDAMIGLGVESFGHLDILVNNAATFTPKLMTDMTEAEWDNEIAINLKSVFLASRRAIPHMQRVGKGKIVNIASIAGIVAFPTFPAYCASKGGVISLTRSMALDFAPEIRVNAISPHAVLTPMLTGFLEQNPGAEQVMLADIPSGSFGKPEDVADAVTYLASDAADQITGQNIVLDGGYTIR